jgi:hypothetical protein
VCWMSEREARLCQGWGVNSPSLGASAISPQPTSTLLPWQLLSPVFPAHFRSARLEAHCGHFPCFTNVGNVGDQREDRLPQGVVTQGLLPTAPTELKGCKSCSVPSLSPRAGRVPPLYSHGAMDSKHCTAIKVQRTSVMLSVVCTKT